MPWLHCALLSLPVSLQILCADEMPSSTALLSPGANPTIAGYGHRPSPRARRRLRVATRARGRAVQVDNSG